MLNKIKKRLFIVCYRTVLMSVVCSIVACSDEPQDQAFVKEKPNADFIVGTWKLTNQSLPLIKKYSGSENEVGFLTLYADEKYSALDFPLVRYEEILHRTTDGKWEFLFFYNWKIVIVSDGFGYSLDIRGQGPYYLTQTIGEPDSDEVLVFVREGDQRAQ